MAASEHRKSNCFSQCPSIHPLRRKIINTHFISSCGLSSAINIDITKFYLSLSTTNLLVLDSSACLLFVRPRCTFFDLYTVFCFLFLWLTHRRNRDAAFYHTVHYHQCNFAFQYLHAPIPSHASEVFFSDQSFTIFSFCFFNYFCPPLSRISKFF